MNNKQKMEMAKEIQKIFNKVLAKTNNMDMTEYMITNKLYQVVHNYVSKDLDLDRYYSFDLIEYDLDNYGGSKCEGDCIYGEFNGYKININEQLKPASCFVYAYDNEDYDILDEAVFVLTVMAHELRHAWQQETGNHTQYIDASVDMDNYLNCDAELDATNYQESVFDNGLYEHLMMEVNNYERYN